MIAFRISLLENFGTCSVIASYYGPTHQSFLLLSQLSKESRKMLDDNYEGILNSLIGTAICLNVYEDEQKDLLSLPCDLFRYDISLCSQITVDLFIQLIERIRNKEGYFFNEHFMHNRLCIERLDLDSELYENFELLLEFLKTTEILYFIAKADKESKILFERCLLIDKCYLMTHYDRDSHSCWIPFPHYVDRNSDKSLLNPLFESFKKIACLNLKPFKFSDAIEALEDVHNLNLQIDRIILISETLKESGDLTNPKYFRNGVNSIEYTYKDNGELTDEFFDNINDIKPKKLSLSFKYGVKGCFDYFRILTFIENVNELELHLDNCSVLCELNFANTIVILKSSNQHPLFIKCKSFKCIFRFNEMNKRFWFSVNKSMKNDSTNESFIHFTDSSFIQLKNHTHITDKHEISKLKDELSELLSECKYEFEFIIPMHNLDSVEIDDRESSEIIESENGPNFIKELYKSPKFECGFNFFKKYHDY